MKSFLISPYFLLIFVCIIFGLNGLSTIYYWNVNIWWFDILMHFLGGAWAASLCLYVLKRTQCLALLSAKLWLLVVFVLGFVYLIAVGWEFFEYLIELAALARGRTLLSRMTLGDTLGDLAMDFFGGLALVLPYLFLIRSKKE